MAGNIVKIKEGSYRLRYKEFSKNIKAKNDREAERFLASFITETDNGDFSRPSKVTFGEFVKKWLKDYAEVELAPKTLFRYKQLLESRILPCFGESKLDKIKPLDIVEFYNSMRKNHKFIGVNKEGKREEKDSGPLSEQTIKHHHRLIKAIYEKAVKWEVIKGRNPAYNVDAPKVEKTKAKCYDEKNIEKMIKALDTLHEEDFKYKVAVMLSLVSGVRLGELMGLEWQDIKFDNRIIEIRQSSQYLPGIGTFTKTPKNENSSRKISANKTIIDLLKTYQQDQQSKGFLCQDNNRLFVKYDGQPMHPYTITKWFPEFLKANKLPHLNFHGLRHTSATFLISKGMDIETVAGRLGHSTSATTQNIYSHFLESKDKKAANIMESNFGKNKKNKKEVKSNKNK